jgi:hypothetical protein
MGITAKKTRVDRARDRVDEILISIFDVDSALMQTPNLFDFKSLPTQYRIELLSMDYARFSKFIDTSLLSVNEKVSIILQNTAREKALGLTEANLVQLVRTSLGRLQYGSLVKVLPEYIRKDLYKHLCQTDQICYFINHPEWVIENIPECPKLRRCDIDGLAQTAPSFIDTYVKDFSQLSTSSRFWVSMINHSTRYRDIFLNNTHSCGTKTDVRQVMYRCPGLIKMVTADIIKNSKLSSKEWVMLIKRVMDDNPSVFSQWQLSDELVELLRVDITAEVLNGDSAMSVQFRNVMKSVL